VPFLLFHLIVGAGSVVLCFVCHNKYVFELNIRCKVTNYFSYNVRLWLLFLIIIKLKRELPSLVLLAEQVGVCASVQH
jgi:hypothetical protein